MTLPENTQAFYFYAEPEAYRDYEIAATTPEGASSGPIPVDSNAGAKYFGFYTTDGSTLSTITVNAQIGFAVGEFGIASAPPDTTAPKVDRVAPTENARGTGPRANVRAAFSEAMGADSISVNTIQLLRVGTDTPLPAAVSYDATANKALLNPDAPLVRGAKYRVMVTPEAKDEAGNRLDQDQDPSNGNQKKAWFFTVRD